MEKINKLHDILIESLPYRDRWLKVDVSDYDNSHQWVKDTHRKNKSHFYVVWNGNKSATNHHNYEIEEVPFSDIDKRIERAERFIKKHEKNIDEIARDAIFESEEKQRQELLMKMYVKGEKFTNSENNC
jgi:hypothetical protein